MPFLLLVFALLAFPLVDHHGLLTGLTRAIALTVLLAAAWHLTTRFLR